VFKVLISEKWYNTYASISESRSIQKPFSFFVQLIIHLLKLFASLTSSTRHNRKRSLESTAPIYLLRTKKAFSENGKNKQKDFEFQTETFRSVFYGKFHNFLGKKKNW